MRNQRFDEGDVVGSDEGFVPEERCAWCDQPGDLDFNPEDGATYHRDCARQAAREFRRLGVGARAGAYTEAETAFRTKMRLRAYAIAMGRHEMDADAFALYAVNQGVEVVDRYSVAVLYERWLDYCDGYQDGFGNL